MKFLALLIFWPTFLFADSLSLIKIIPITANLFTTDKAGSIYIAKNNNSIYRYSANGDSTGYCNNIRRGKVSQIDATNPMRVLVYNADYENIDVLDRMLTIKNSIDLRKLRVQDCPAISYSADGDTWIYNNFTAELMKITDELKITYTSFNFLQQFGTNVQPSQLVEQDKYLFLVDSLNGIYKFDRFGTFILLYPFYCNELQFIDNKLIYYSKGKLHLYNTITIKEKEIDLPDSSNILNARIERERIYVLRKDGLYIYKFTDSN